MSQPALTVPALTIPALTVPALTIEDLWQQADFQPNGAQRAAIQHSDGPLYLLAGPGTGKTRVLLWHAVNLIVCHHVPPDADPQTPDPVSSTAG